MRRTVKSLLLAVCIGFGSIGPAYAEELEFIGNSRIEMSDWLKKQWDKYQNAFNKGTLLIKFDEGKVWISHWACHSGHTSTDCYSENRSQMMYRVRLKSKKWQIFAEEGKIVWEGPVCYQGQNLSRFGDCNSYNSGNQNASSSSSNSSSSDGSHLKEMDDKTLCFGATKADGNWDLKYEYMRKFAAEAMGRRLSLERCSELTGRPNPFPKATQNPPAKSVSKESDSVEIRLGKLKKLEDAGLITSEEAAEKRKEILRDM